MRQVSVHNVPDSTGDETIAVGAAATVYTKAIKIEKDEYFGLKYRCTSAAGAPSMKIQIEQSDRLPATEGSSDTHYVIPEGMADVETALTTELWKIKSLSPVTAPYIRFKLTEGGAQSDSIVELVLMKQEELR